MKEEDELKKIFPINQKRTWLAGAGISLSPPSSLPTGNMILTNLIKLATPSDYYDELIELTNPNRKDKKSSGDFLRFEQVMEVIHHNLDPKLQILDFIGEVNSPNRNHEFLAKAARQGDLIFTTNFDHLIEQALVEDLDSVSRVIPVITESEFLNEYAENDIPIYKLHGSILNILTGESTRDTLGATLERIGLGAEDAFSLEDWKRNPLERATKEHDLVIIGYSGSDSFDVMPTLKKIPQIKSVIRILHQSNRKCEEAEIFHGPMESIEGFEDPFRELVCPLITILIDTGYLLEYLAQEVYKFELSIKKLESSSPPSDFISIWNKLFVFEKGRKLFIAGRIFQEKDQVEKAIDCFKKSEKACRKNGNKIGEARSLNNLAMALVAKGKNEEAIQKYQQALKLARNSGLKSGIANNLLNMGALYAKSGRISEAIENFKESLIVFQELNDKKGMSKALSNLGKTYVELGDLKQALRYNEESLVLAKEIGDRTTQANIISHAANIQMELGNFKEAIALNREMIEISRVMGDKDGFAIGLGNLATTYHRAGNNQESLKLFQEALPMLKELGFKDIFAHMLIIKGAVMNELGYKEEGIKTIEKAIELEMKLKNEIKLAMALDNISYYLKKMGKLDESRGYLIESIELYRKIGLKKDLANTLGRMGDILSDIDEYQDSISYHKEAYLIYIDLEMQVKAAAQLANLSIPYYYLGQKEKAHQHIDDAIALAKKLNDEKLVEQMKGMKNRYN
ncbi:MAG: tetratricopeptide repeat protein [Promethearchaeota archaeon]